MCHFSRISAIRELEEVITSHRSVPDTYIHHGTPAELYAEAGFDTAAMVENAKKLVGYLNTQAADVSQDKVG